MTPFINRQMPEVVAQWLNRGFTSNMIQSMSGIPVKVWINVAVTNGISPVLFLTSIGLSRWLRMLAIAGLGRYLGLHAKPFIQRNLLPLAGLYALGLYGLLVITSGSLF